MDIAAHGVVSVDEDDDLPGFEDEEAEEESSKGMDGEVVQVIQKEEEGKVKKEEEEQRAMDRNEEIRRMKDQEWEMLRYALLSFP
jgi:hypothetical protein